MIDSACAAISGTSVRIMRCAQELAAERGFDGFTMNDLAVASGLARRTLFNHFPSKVDAVLGECPTLDHDDVAEFRSGGPDHDLVLDLRTLIVPCLGAKITDRETAARVKRILPASPRLMATMHQRYEAMSAEVVEHVVAREGASFGAPRARVAVMIIAALLQSALEAFLHDPRERTVSHHFDESLHTARSLFGA